MNSVIKLYVSFTGQEPVTCQKIAGGGSNRQYYRITDRDGKSVIGATGTSSEENNTFIYLSRHFASRGLPVPRILTVSTDGMTYLQSDLGNTTLYEALKQGRWSEEGYSPEDVRLLETTIRLLPQIQVNGACGLDFRRCYPVQEMDVQSVMFDLNYFKYCFLKTTSPDFNEMKLEQCFANMAHDLGSSPSPYFMYRDFQARNVMIDAQGSPYFIDYQGGRKGPLQYDLVSFLWQASSHFSDEIREHLIDVYIESVKKYVDIDEDEFRNSIPRWVLFRTLQVLGAYGFRGRFERKKYFLDSIPGAISNLRDILTKPKACPYPYLHDILNQLVSLPEFAEKTVPQSSSYSTINNHKSLLKVRVFSFSYKKGIPEDTSGNGGGYVFDCRAIHNPGRYEPYKQLTGLDQPVIDFIEENGEMAEFLAHIYPLADNHVERYLKRGFTSLMFSFGCTGGQHRSVYGAQHLAEHIHSQYGIEVTVIHRERGITTVLPAKRKAMIFAAGLGTRLKPLTDNCPKALVPVAGKPLIEHTLKKLVSAGFNDIVVNVHHFADMIEQWGRNVLYSKEFIDKNVTISFSDERAELLETGGGISHAMPLLSSANPEEKVLIHNVDILSTVNLNELCNYSSSSVSAVLLISRRKTARYLVFDDNMRLVGWTNIQTGEIRSSLQELHAVLPTRSKDSYDVGGYHLRAFAGIHYINTSLVGMMQSWPHRFGIIDFYLAICHDVEIMGYEPSDLQIIDVGKHDTLSEAELFVKELL